MSRRSSTGSRSKARSAAGSKPALSKPRAKTAAAKHAAGAVLHLDTFSGISGNMMMGALLDAGLSRKQLETDLAGLGLTFALRVRRVMRGALAARHVEVMVPDEKNRMRPADGRDTHQPASHSHGHAHSHDHSHSHPSHDHDPAHGRTHREIVELLEGAKLAAPVRERALAIYEGLARAEARVHGIPVERVQFHEVGAVDAIVDVTAAAIGLHRLGVTRVTATPPAIGHGTVKTAHGVLPIPAPATLELLTGIPTVPSDVAWETVTPTGAAILRACVDEFRTLPAMTPEAIGHGAGNDRPGAMPNVLRAVLGRGANVGTDRVVVLETNLDDLVPEHFEYLMERLFEAGALDVGLQHLQMKKNRPGFLVRVLGRPADRRELAGILFAESTAIGVRTSEWDRLVLERKIRRVDTRFGRLRVKIVHTPEGREQASPEYDDCKRAAAEHGVPLREVIREAEARAAAHGEANE